MFAIFFNAHIIMFAGLDSRAEIPVDLYREQLAAAEHYLRITAAHATFVVAHPRGRNSETCVLVLPDDLFKVRFVVIL
jgi:hypothetical protein